MQELRLTDDLVIWQGDVRQVLARLPDNSVQCVVTSPPFWGLRNYNAEDQIGMEPTIAEFVAELVTIFREIRRILRPDGVLWLNLGDSYNGSGGAGGDYRAGGLREGQPRYPGRRDPSLKKKDLCGVPWRVALALQADGWYLRSDVIWHKPNPFPESVADRPTRCHEYLFMLTKLQRYFYDADAIREPLSAPHDYPTWQERKAKGAVKRRGDPGVSGDVNKWNGVGANPAGRNKRTVWTVTTSPFKGAHFATFPPKLIEPCILAGTSPFACPSCSAPWRREIEVAYTNPRNRTTNGPRSLERRDESPGFAVRLEKQVKTIGWAPTCRCEGNDGRGKCWVLDPFGGSGTTGEVGLMTGRAVTLIELNPDYVNLAKERLAKVQLKLGT